MRKYSAGRARGSPRVCPICRRAADGSEIFSTRDDATIRSDQECTVPGADGRFDWDRGVRSHSGGTACSKKAQGTFFHRIVERLSTHDGVRARRFPRAGHQTRRTWQCPPSLGLSWRRHQKRPPMRSPAVANGPPYTFRWPCCRGSGQPAAASVRCVFDQPSQGCLGCHHGGPGDAERCGV